MNSPAKKSLILVGIPILTLFVGWQLGRESIPPRAGALPSVETATGAEAIANSVDLSLLWTSWQALQETYISPEKLVPQTMVYGAIHGLVDSLKDPYTVFMAPDESREFRSVLTGALQGIGAELDLHDGQIVVIAPLRGSPAEEAGLLPGDVIETVDGTSTEGMTLSDVVGKIRGPKGTKVVLDIERDGHAGLLEVSIERDDIHVPSVESSTKGTIGVINLNQFGDSSTVEFRDALVGLLQQKVTGLIVDLRGDGGGYLEGAGEIASFFLPPNHLVVTVAHREGDSERHETKGEPIVPDLPLVVLVNQGTASAAEILAGALQDEGRATIVGTKTFGKGTVQDVIDLPGGSAIKITTARWLTPKGRDIGADRITPDLVVERTSDDIIANKDPQLDAALGVLDGSVAVPATGGGSEESAS